ncbi:hypothetical protein [Anaerococcus tetradius]|uniref:Uncharacterized protein n=1 Tax=Anaerococcus tetradius ATCC 35098 TaxID=525255 RepID=C2CFX9_9FIRM|nr:hypothetical protein [Anaerococcus tetradius]EEI83507.1 hypothetical protein HMPREF0077_0389 [Anaerococcus tetradius ATCC 35098]
MTLLDMMYNSEGKNIKVFFKDGTVKELYCEEYVQAEDEWDEPMLFYGGNGAILKSQIEKIEILD